VRFTILESNTDGDSRAEMRPNNATPLRRDLCSGTCDGLESWRRWVFATFNYVSLGDNIDNL